jgi:hypothetical protein
MNAEGWFVDPFGNHQARWISEGRPTALVRDGTVETQDPPPRIDYSGPFERLAPEGHSDSHDMPRADDAEGAQPDYGQAGMSAITTYFPPGPM